MTSASCLDKKRFPAFRNIFAFTFKRNLGVTLLGCAIALLCCAAVGINDDDVTAYSLSQMFNEVSVSFMVISCGVLALSMFLNLKYLYSKPATDMYHSLPISWSKLLISQTLAAYVGAAAVHLVGNLAYALFNVAKVGNWIPAINLFEAWAEGLLFLLIMASLLAFHAVLAGNAFGTVFALGVTQLGIPLLAQLARLFADEMLVGSAIMNSEYDGICFNSSLTFKSVLVYVERVTEISMKNNLAKVPYLEIIGGIIASALLLFLATYIYKRRRSETAGSAFSFKYVRHISMVVAVVLVGYAVGALFGDAHFGGAFWIFALFGCLISAVALGALVDKGFKMVKVSIVAGAVSFAVLAAAAFGFAVYKPYHDNYIPKAESIKSSSYRIGEVEVKYTDSHDKVFALHKAAIEDATYTVPDEEYIVDDKFIDVETKLAVIDTDNTVAAVMDIHHQTVEIVYELKNGRRVVRDYFLSQHQAIFEIMTDENYLEAKRQGLFEYNEKQEKIVLELNDSARNNDGVSAYDEDAVIISRADAERIIDSYVKEFSEFDLEDINTPHEYGDCVYIYNSLSGRWASQYTFTIPIFEGFENTLDIIEDVIGFELVTEYK